MLPHMTTGSPKTSSASEPRLDTIPLVDALAGFDNGVLLTHSLDPASGGHLHARPLALADVTASAVWFSTDIGSRKVDEALKDPRATLVLQKSGRHAVVHGHVRFSDDPTRIGDLWRPGWRLFFDGPDDPMLVLLVLEVEGGELWDTTGAKRIRYLLHKAANAISGARDEVDVDPSHADIVSGPL